MTESNSNGDLLNTDEVRGRYGIGRVVMSGKYLRQQKVHNIPIYWTLTKKSWTLTMVGNFTQK